MLFGERSGVSPPSLVRDTRWADTHRSPDNLNGDRVKYEWRSSALVPEKIE
jgi:hypothetical protein